MCHLHASRGGRGCAERDCRRGLTATVAHRTGMSAEDALRSQVAAAMQNVVAASQEPAQAAGGRSLVAPGRGEPNLIINLADLIRRQQAREGHPIVNFVGAGSDGFGVVSLDTIGGAVRERFGGRMLAAPTDDAATTATGALLLGYSLAEPDVAARRREHPVSWPEGIDHLPQPWLVARPIFLDAVLWMLGTALPEN